MLQLYFNMILAIIHASHSAFASRRCKQKHTEADQISATALNQAEIVLFRSRTIVFDTTKSEPLLKPLSRS